MDIVNNFITEVNKNTEDIETRESFVGFAKDAESDPDKMAVLNTFITEYMRNDGSFDPIMFENPSYVLLDMYDEYLTAKGK